VILIIELTVKTNDRSRERRDGWMGRLRDREPLNVRDNTRPEREKGRSEMREETERCR